MVQIRGVTDAQLHMDHFILMEAGAACRPLSASSFSHPSVASSFSHPSVHHHSTKGLQDTGKMINTGFILRPKPFERGKHVFMRSYLFINSR